MKVVHFSPIYIDNWGYQDNLLPKYFKEMGHDVCVIAPEKKSKKHKNHEPNKNKYFIDGVEIRRIKVNLYLTFTFFIPRGLYKNMKNLKPDILFHHGISLPSLFICSLYKLLHPKCKFFIDNHTDEINQSNSKIWLVLYSKILLRFFLKLISPLVIKFYGVSYSRCDYLSSVYKINKNKISFLPIGADTIAVDKMDLSNELIKSKYSIPENTFIVVTGGNMGVDKGTVNLINVTRKTMRS